jgi:hypothetical protein
VSRAHGPVEAPLAAGEPLAALVASALGAPLADAVAPPDGSALARADADVAAEGAETPPLHAARAADAMIASPTSPTADLTSMSLPVQRAVATR